VNKENLGLFITVGIGIILIVLLVANEWLNTEISDIQQNRTEMIELANTFLSDSHDKMFYALGNQIQATNCMIQGNMTCYNSNMDDAKKSKALGDELYTQAQLEYQKFDSSQTDLNNASNERATIYPMTIIVSVGLTVLGSILPFIKNKKH
jgi:hypothetical protein